MTSKTDSLMSSVRRGLIAGREPVDHASVVAAVRRAPGVPLAGDALLATASEVSAELSGAGRLQPLLDDPEVTDVLVNGPAEVWVDRGDGLRRAPVRFDGGVELRSLATRLAAACGRRLDDANPCADARLPDGTRFHAVLPPVAVNGPHLSLRTHRAKAFSLAELRAAGTVTSRCAQLLDNIVAAKIPFLVSGGTGVGKTTLLSTLLGRVNEAERLVIVEDATELSCAHPHALSLQARRPNVESAGEVTLRELVRQSLRMRPDRIIVGECRGAEIIELLTALNTGHEGGAGTLHANAAADVPARLAALALPHGLSRVGLHTMLDAALKVVIHMTRRGANRVVSEIGLLEFDPGHESVTVVPAWRRGSGAGPGLTALRDILQAAAPEVEAAP